MLPWLQSLDTDVTPEFQFIASSLNPALNATRDRQIGSRIGPRMEDKTRKQEILTKRCHATFRTPIKNRKIAKTEVTYNTMGPKCVAHSVFPRNYRLWKSMDRIVNRRKWNHKMSKEKVTYNTVGPKIIPCRVFPRNHRLWMWMERIVNSRKRNHKMSKAKVTL